MTTNERIAIRAALLDAGFRRRYEEDEPNMYDVGLCGIYTEYWRHDKDRTRIILQWDRKTKE